MKSLKRTLLSLSVAALSVGVLSPVANAQVAEGTSSGASVEDAESYNAAAAVHIEYTYQGTNEVESLSAASSFGEESAVAAAGPLGATSVGTSSEVGAVEFVDTDDSNGNESSKMTVDFETDDFEGSVGNNI